MSSTLSQRSSTAPKARHGYIADFVAPAAGLVIEVDGACHDARANADARRDRVLAKLGYRVLRLDANTIVHEPIVALDRVQAALTHPR